VDLESCRENFRVREEQRALEREAHRQAARSAILSAIQAILPVHPEVRRIYLFGSIIRPGAFRFDSDIDVAVEGTNAEQYFALWRDLEEAAPGWLIDLREINQPSYFADAVKERGELVYERKG
jgi:predicted nucleotidyltransferase